MELFTTLPTQVARLHLLLGPDVSMDNLADAVDVLGDAAVVDVLKASSELGKSIEQIRTAAAAGVIATRSARQRGHSDRARAAGRAAVAGQARPARLVPRGAPHLCVGRHRPAAQTVQTRGLRLRGRRAPILGWAVLLYYSQVSLAACLPSITVLLVPCAQVVLLASHRVARIGHCPRRARKSADHARDIADPSGSVAV